VRYKKVISTAEKNAMQGLINSGIQNDEVKVISAIIKIFDVHFQIVSNDFEEQSMGDAFASVVRNGGFTAI